MTPKKPPRQKIMKRVCPDCEGRGTVNEDPPRKGRKKCDTCSGKQWVPA